MTPLRSLFAALLLPLGATAHAQEWKEIRFGVFPEYPPFESVAADGSLQGFDIELGNAICAKLEVKCTWVHNEFDGMIPALRARKFDAIMSSMAVTPAREKIIDFSDRLFLSPTSVITRKSADFGDTPESLMGKQVGVLQGSLQEAYARAHLAKLGAQIKAGNGMPARIDARVEEVVANVRRHAEGHGLDPQLYDRLWRQLIEAAIAQEERQLNKDRP